MANDVLIRFRGEDVNLEKVLNTLESQIEDLENQVRKLSGKPLDIPTDPAEESLKDLRRELKGLERAFDSAVNAREVASELNKVAAGTDKAAAAARRLATAEGKVATQGKRLIDFAKRLPPELAKGVGQMDRLEKETEQATRAFRSFSATTGASGRALGDLIRAIGSLRAGLGALVAALGIQQLGRLVDRLVQIGAAAVETKVGLDRLIPGLRAFTGSTELAEEVADGLAETAAKLKTPLAGLVNPFLGIASGGREAGLTISEIDELFEQSLRSARAFGKGAADVQRLLTGISQVAGKGVASLEEFRQQIGEAIPNAIPALAKGLSQAEGRIVTTAEAIARVSSGSLESADALRALTAGFEALNSAAAAGQLDTLGGDLDGFRAAAERAQKALADGLQPGLRILLQSVTDLIEQNPTLIRQLGEIGGNTIAGLGRLVQVFEEVAKGVRVLGSEALETAAFLEKIPGAALFGLDGAAAGYRSVGNALSGLEAQAKVTFKAVEDGARLAALGSRQSAEDILESFRKSFKEQAKEAGASAEEIEQNAKDLADAVGAIAEESAEFRAQLERRFVDEIKETGEISVETSQEAAEAILRIEQASAEERAKLLTQLVASTKKASEARIEAERKASEAIRAEARAIIEEAQKVAAERIKVDEELATKIEEIEQEKQEKLLALVVEFEEKRNKPKADRVKIAQELADKVVEIERAAAEKIRREQERVAEAAEKAAEQRRKAEEKVQEVRAKSIDQLGELVDKLNEVAEGADDDGGSVFERTKEDVEGLTDAVDELLVTLEQVNAGDLGNPLENLGGDPRSGDNAAAFFESIGQGAADASGDLVNLTDDLLAALDAAKGLGLDGKQAVADLVSQFEALATSGQATRADQQDFANALTQIYQGLPQPLETAVSAIQAQIDQLRASQDEAASSADQTAESFQTAGDTAAVAWDPLTNTLSTVEGSARSTGEAVEEAGVRIERTAEGITITNEALEDTEAAGEKAAEGLRSTGEAASDAKGPLGEVGSALEAFKGELIGEEEPQKLRDLGVAAGEAAPLLIPLAPPIESIAMSSERLGAVLPVLTEQAPLLAAAATAIFEAIEGQPENLAALAEAVERIAPPLASIGVALEPIRAAVLELPEPLGQVQEALTLLAELVLAAAEDQRFDRIGTGLLSIAEALPPIPEPLEKVQVALSKLADRKQDVEDALLVVKVGLEAASTEELLGRLGDLRDLIDELVELVSEIAKQTDKWKTTLDQIVSDMPELLQKLQNLADRLRNDVVPSLNDAAVKSGEVTTAFGEARAASGLLTTALLAVAEQGGPALDAILEKLRAITAEAGRAAAALQAVAAAAATVQLPTGGGGGGGTVEGGGETIIIPPAGGP